MRFNLQQFQQSNKRVDLKMRYHFSNIHHFLETAVIDGLTPQAKADIQNYIRERRVDESGGSVLDTVKYVAFAALGVIILICIIYYIYQCCKNKSSQYQSNIAAEGGYQPNYPVGAGQPYQVQANPFQVPPSALQARNPRGRDVNFAESVTWQLNTDGRL